MSGLIVVYNRNGAPVAAGALQAAMESLAHRGPDGGDTWLSGPVGLGHQHRWSTPEEVGERQPLADSAGRHHLVFDGRLDNREELYGALGMDQVAGQGLSDARLFLQAYERWGERCLERLLGEFALALYDKTEGRVLLARDPLGDRTLFYHLEPQLLVVASEEHAVLAHPAVSAHLDERTLAHYYAFRVPEDGSTFYAEVKELLPGHVMLVDRDGMRQRRYWQAAPGELRYGDDEQYAEQFLDLLRQSVAARLRSAGPVGVMMSGGLDSTSVAAVAAEALARAGSGPLRTYSYVFDELASCDERPYIQAQVAHCGLEATFVPGDDGWPLRDPQTWPVIPDAPWGGLYWRLMERIYRAAQEQGVRVLLGGWFGDHLYSGAEEWLADLIWEGRWLDAAQDLRQAARRFGWRWALWEGGGFGVIKRAWWALPGGRHLWPRRTAKPTWLTAYALNLLPMEHMEPLTGDTWRNTLRGQSILGLLTSRQASSCYVQERAGMETRSPYRDRRLVEFMLSVPAHQLFRQGRYKHVLRNAMRGLSPAVVVNRRVPTSLMPLARRGLAERELPTVQRLLLSPDAAWPRYVRADWLTNDLPSRLSPQRDGAEAVVPWRCICVELWRNAYGRSDVHTASWRPH